MWVEKQKCFSLLNINYKDVIQNTLQQAVHINRFLDSVLDSEAMASVVDPSPYHQKL